MVAAPILSVLALRHANDQSIELLAHRDLAGQPRIRFPLGGKAEHARLLRSRHRSPGLVEPRRIDIDVAGGAGALAAAIGVDSGDVVVDGAAHHRKADRHLHRMLGAVMFDVGDFGHGRQLACSWRIQDFPTRLRLDVNAARSRYNRHRYPYSGSQENASPERSSGINEGLSAGKACSAIAS